MDELVTAVIPFYSNKQWLIEAIDSILNQTYKNIEIIVIDDGSNEDTSEIHSKYKDKIIYIKKENGGPASARNIGIKMAKGQYIAFLDSDDIWYPKKIEIQLEYMKKTGVMWSQHSYVYFNEKGIIKTVDTTCYAGNILPYLYTSFRVQTSCFMMNVCVFNENVQFDENKRYGEDAALYKKLGLKYPLGSIDDILTKFRIRENNAGLDPFIQINSRADTWKNEKDSDCYKKNTSFIIKCSYIFCYFISTLIRKLKINNVTLGKALYILPWCLFKMDSKIKRNHL